MAILSTILLFISGSIFWVLKASPWGRLLKSVRDDELCGSGIGQKCPFGQGVSPCFTCAFAALSGTIYVSYITYIDPSSASLDHSILMLCMLIVGGSGNFWGPLVGAAVLLGIPEILRFVHIPDLFAANLRLLAYGVLLIIMVHVRPQGLAGEYRLK